MPKILIVDDDEKFAELIGEKLRQWGYEPLFAFDGIVGTVQARKHLPDLILLDFNMPGAHGGEVSRRLETVQPTGRPVPIIFLSSFPLEHLKKYVSAQSGAHYLQKPFDFEQLHTLISQLIGGGKPGADGSKKPSQ